MMDEMSKLLAKKGKATKMSDEDVMAKEEVLKELLQLAMETIGGDVKSGLDGMKKVEVASTSPEGLEEGLEKAQEIVGEMPEMEEESEPKEDASEAMQETSLAEDDEEESEEDEEAAPKKRPIFDLL